jgi:hypothetical protein
LKPDNGELFGKQSAVHLSYRALAYALFDNPEALIIKKEVVEKIRTKIDASGVRGIEFKPSLFK